MRISTNIPKATKEVGELIDWLNAPRMTVDDLPPGDPDGNQIETLHRTDQCERIEPLIMWINEFDSLYLTRDRNERRLAELRRLIRSEFSHLPTVPVLDWETEKGLGLRLRADRFSIEMRLRVVATSSSLPQGDIDLKLRTPPSRPIPNELLLTIPAPGFSGGWRPNPSFIERHARDVERVLLIFTLHERGLLVRLRRCEREKCRKWFFAEFLKKRFHVPNCSTKRKRETPEGKKRFNAYQRKKMAFYRASQKENNARGLEFIRNGAK
jgi:hypothetical protein